ncbi:MAG: hypothetical protein JNM56_33055 [Planctomycetia bacterium]|nr:hypothetical protein [Planctomycetia bacterium]
MLVSIDRMTRAGTLRYYAALLTTGQTVALGQMTLQDGERVMQAIEDQTRQRVRLTNGDVSRALDAGQTLAIEQRASA